MALSEMTKRNVKSYVKKKVVSTGTVAEVKDLLLFFILIQQEQDYCKLAAYTSQIYEIYGFEHAVEGVFRLDHHFGRRFRFSPWCIRKRINFDDKEVVDYLFERIEYEIRKKLKKLSSFYSCGLAKQYPAILEALLNNLRKVQQYDNKESLTWKQIEKVVREEISKKHVAAFNLKRIKLTETPAIKNHAIASPEKDLIVQLTNEFFTGQRELKEVFSLYISAKEITEQRIFFESLTAPSKKEGQDIIAETLTKARRSRYVHRGADYHIRPGIYAAIATQAIVLVTSILLTAALQWGFPLIPIVGSSSAFMAMISTITFTLLQFPMMTSLYPYIVHRREKVDNIIKTHLALRLGKSVPMYQARLNKSGVDLGKFAESAFTINPHMQRRSGLFGHRRWNPSTGEGVRVEDKDETTDGETTSDIPLLGKA